MKLVVRRSRGGVLTPPGSFSPITYCAPRLFSPRPLGGSEIPPADLRLAVDRCVRCARHLPLAGSDGPLPACTPERAREDRAGDSTSAVRSMFSVSAPRPAGSVSAQWPLASRWPECSARRSGPARTTEGRRDEAPNPRLRPGRQTGNSPAGGGRDRRRIKRRGRPPWRRLARRPSRAPRGAGARRGTPSPPPGSAAGHRSARCSGMATSRGNKATTEGSMRWKPASERWWPQREEPVRLLALWGRLSKSLAAP